MHLTRKTAIGVTAVAGTLAAVGVGWAAIPDQAGTIHACYDGGGNLRVVAPRTACRPREFSLSWNQRGPVGAQGPTGPAGPKGDPGIGTAFASGADVFEIPPATGTSSTIASKVLPAGSYVVSAKLYGENTDASEEAQIFCRLDAGLLSGIDVGGTRLAVVGKAGFEDTVALQATLADFAGGTLELQCGQSGTASAGATVYDVRLTAIRVDEVS